MRKIFFIITSAGVLFLIEFILFNLVGRWFKPNLLLLLVVFIDLFWGIRYGIVTAIVAGLLKDSFGLNVFGLHMLAFLSAAYLTIVLRRYLYLSGSRTSYLLMILCVSLGYFCVEYILHWMFRPLHVMETFGLILIPQLLTTLVVTMDVFRQLKKCALKFSV